MAPPRARVRAKPQRPRPTGSGSWVAPRMLTVAALRGRLAATLKDLDGPAFVTQRGEARAVLLPVDAYSALVAQLEYLDDSLEVLLAREQRERGEDGTRPWKDVRRELLSAPSPTGRARAGNS